MSRFGGYSEPLEVLVDILNETRRTNELLEKLLPQQNEQVIDIDSLKRPDLMKLMAQRDDAPQGWNKWGTEEMRKFIKGDHHADE
ncbi:hypothetical protein [Paenibacillus rigui]|uniref:Uncharacterized protein n=1 Tax=Paenibacillus rigui TaxID=554312 RepID=A0A229UKI7_9BACL|nr:hypothetical protein [Paenibacillus rigui]OXM83967.1 hypothetical protein CF651_22910 [Paenibacillus rigui]